VVVVQLGLVQTLVTLVIPVTGLAPSEPPNRKLDDIDRIVRPGIITVEKIEELDEWQIVQRSLV